MARKQNIHTVTIEKRSLQDILTIIGHLVKRTRENLHGVEDILDLKALTDWQADFIGRLWTHRDKPPTYKIAITINLSEYFRILMLIQNMEEFLPVYEIQIFTQELSAPIYRMLEGDRVRDKAQA